MYVLQKANTVTIQYTEKNNVKSVQKSFLSHHLTLVLSRIVFGFE